MSEPDEVIEGPIETVLLLARLEQAGSLGTCVACRRSCVWRHPVYGFMHPRCCPRALVLLEVDVWAPDPVVAAPRERVRARRGAYDRHRVA